MIPVCQPSASEFSLLQPGGLDGVMLVEGGKAAMDHQTGKFTIHRKTIGKRMAAKLKDVRAQLRQRMHERIPGTGKWLQQVVRGYFQYHAIPGNSARLRAFRSDVLWN